MKFKFKNLGIVKEADIELNGLTVLTGLNDSGKSFIGKAIYSIVKTTNEYEKTWDIKKYDFLMAALNQIFSLHRQSIPYTQDKFQRYNPEILRSKIVDSIIYKKLSNQELLEALDKYSTDIIQDIFDSEGLFRPVRPLDKIAAEIKSLATGISSYITENPDNENKLKFFFDEQIIQGQFLGQINTITAEDLPLEILVSEGVSELLQVSVLKNKSNQFLIKSPLLIRDAIIIETPTIIQLEKFITNTLAFSPSSRQRNDLPIYYNDIIRKIRIGQVNLALNYLNIFDDIRNIIGGQFIFKNEEGGIIFSKNNGDTIRSFNIATGVKSFGLLQLLLRCGAINQDSILIIDEPEVHLHPQWVIQYAQIVVDLCIAGIPIIISSHSPYLIEAIGKYSEAKRFSHKVKFYFGERQKSGLSRFNDVTSDVTPIFNALAQPMRDLTKLPF